MEKQEKTLSQITCIYEDTEQSIPEHLSELLLNLNTKGITYTKNSNTLTLDNKYYTCNIELKYSSLNKLQKEEIYKSECILIFWEFLEISNLDVFKLIFIYMNRNLKQC